MYTMSPVISDDITVSGNYDGPDKNPENSSFAVCAPPEIFMLPITRYQEFCAREWSYMLPSSFACNLTRYRYYFSVFDMPPPLLKIA
jgi:hypothetical protein